MSYRKDGVCPDCKKRPRDGKRTYCVECGRDRNRKYLLGPERERMCKRCKNLHPATEYHTGYGRCGYPTFRPLCTACKDAEWQEDEQNGKGHRGYEDILALVQMTAGWGTKPWMDLTQHQRDMIVNLAKKECAIRKLPGFTGQKYEQRQRQGQAA